MENELKERLNDILESVNETLITVQDALKNLESNPSLKSVEDNVPSAIPIMWTWDGEETTDISKAMFVKCKTFAECEWFAHEILVSDDEEYDKNWLHEVSKGCIYPGIYLYNVSTSAYDLISQNEIENLYSLLLK